jgi:hypothetical protein
MDINSVFEVNVISLFGKQEKPWFFRKLKSIIPSVKMYLEWHVESPTYSPFSEVTNHDKIISWEIKISSESWLVTK